MQVIDPMVSKRKFDEALDQFRSAERVQHGRGIFLVHASFPDMEFLFSAPRLTPLPVLFSVKINFDNYDLEPLSVRFIHPLTGQHQPTITIPLFRKIEHPGRQPECVALVQQEVSGLPFICMPGIREYHSHPAHTGDAWLNHRGIAGEGTLGFILDKLHQYGIAPVVAFQAAFQVAGVTMDQNLIPT